MASSRRRALAGALVVALIGTAVGVTGCGGGGGSGGSAAPPASDAPTTEAPTTTTSTPSDEEAILAANSGFWRAWILANDPPDPGHPELATYGTGAALERVRSSIETHRSQGQVLRAPAESQARHTATVIELGADTAIVEDCSIDDAVVIDAASGRVLNDDVVTWLYRTELSRASGEWKVGLVTAVERWKGVTGCAA